MNLPQTVPANVEVRKRPFIQPATPLVPGYVSGLREVYSKPRAVTDPIVLRKPLNDPPKNNIGRARKGKGKAGKQDDNGAERSPPSKVTAAQHQTSNIPDTVVATATSDSVTAAGAPASRDGLSSEPAQQHTKSAPLEVAAVKDAAPNTPRMAPDVSTPSEQFLFASEVGKQEGSPSKECPSPAESQIIPAQLQRDRPEGMMLGDGLMSPTRVGTFGRLGNVNIMSAPRVASLAAQVETAEPSPSSIYPAEELPIVCLPLQNTSN